MSKDIVTPLTSKLQMVREVLKTAVAVFIYAGLVWVLVVSIAHGPDRIIEQIKAVLPLLEQVE